MSDVEGWGRDGELQHTVRHCLNAVWVCTLLWWKDMRSGRVEEATLIFNIFLGILQVQCMNLADCQTHEWGSLWSVWWGLSGHCWSAPLCSWWWWLCPGQLGLYPWPPLPCSWPLPPGRMAEMLIEDVKGWQIQIDQHSCCLHFSSPSLIQHCFAGIFYVIKPFGLDFFSVPTFNWNLLR